MQVFLSKKDAFSRIFLPITIVFIYIFVVNNKLKQWQSILRRK